MTLGWRSLEELCNGMTSEEFSIWQEMYSRNPWGELRADLRNAQLQQTIATVSGRVKEPPKLDRFMLFRDREEEPDNDPISRALLKKE